MSVDLSTSSQEITSFSTNMDDSSTQNGEAIDTPVVVTQDMIEDQYDILPRATVNRPDTPMTSQLPIYRPLQGSEIRLFSIQRNRENWMLRCSMFHVPLTKDLKFHALSYVWGDPKHTRTILVNDQPLQVTQNLFDFLDQAWQTEDLFQRRYPSNHDKEGYAEISTEAVHWWVDAICINQEDIDEKNEQVPRISQLYSSAYQVWVWLGRRQTLTAGSVEYIFLQTALSIAFIKELFDIDARGGEHGALGTQLRMAVVNRAIRMTAHEIWERMRFDIWVGSTPDAPIMEFQAIVDAVEAGVSENDIRKRADLPPIPGGVGKFTVYPVPDEFLQKLLRQIGRLMASPWFDRTWIIQEFALSYQPPIAVIGNYSFYCSHLYKLCEHAIKSRSTMSHETYCMLQSINPNICKLSKLIRTVLWRGGQGALYEVPEFSLLSPAYKLLHLLRMFGGKHSTVPHDHIYGMLGLLNGELPGHLKPDYRRSFDGVCQDYARFIIEDTGDLRIIETYGSELEGCPSWVPDLRYLDLPRKINAASTTGAAHFSDDGQHLTVEGVSVGGVSICSCNSSHSADQSLISHLRMINDVILTGSAWLTRRPLEAVFTAWLEVMLVRQLKRPPRTLSDIKSMEALISAFTTCCLPTITNPETLPRLRPSSFSNLFTKNAPSSDLFRTVHVLAAPDYSLLETGSIAICHLKMPEPQTRHHEGDAVWALKGCEKLSILRPRDGGHVYAGICMVLQDDVEDVPVASRFGMVRFGESLSYMLDEEFFASNELERVVLV